MARKKRSGTKFTRKKKRFAPFGYAPKFNALEKELYKIWSTPTSGAAFSGVNNLLLEAKRQGVQLHKTNVETFLNKLQTYQTFIQRHRRFPRAKVFSKGPKDLAQMDLLQLEESEGRKYILTGKKSKY